METRGLDRIETHAQCCYYKCDVLCNMFCAICTTTIVVAVQADDEVVTSVATVQAVENCVVRVIELVNSAAMITAQRGAGFRRRSRTFA